MRKIVCEYGIHYTCFSLDAKVLFSKFLQPIQELENKREMALAAAFNWMPWLALGDVANVGQLTGLNAVQLIGMIIRAANNARMHKKNCRQFAQHLKLISNLLEQLSFSELTKREETREPLALFEESLRKAVVLVESCRDKSYLYLVAMGWVYVNKFREYEDEIDKYLKLIPLISLVEDSRKKLKAIEKDRKPYTLENDELKVQESLLKRDLSRKNSSSLSRKDSSRLSRQLSKRYPGLPLTEALRTENEMLRNELQVMKARMEVQHCNVIERLIEVTENENLPT
jgi:dsDNA-binding SOS-regulon protein